MYIYITFKSQQVIWLIVYSCRGTTKLAELNKILLSSPMHPQDSNDLMPIEEKQENNIYD